MKSVASLMVVVGYASVALAQAPDSAQGNTAIEEIYVARSLRESRVMPTPFCAQERIGFGGTTVEDRYAFYSVDTRASDGLITNASRNTIGDIHACFAPTADPRVLNFYGEGSLGRISFTVIGECSLQADDPEPGITFASCAVDLRDLPEGYVGGHLTSSTILSRQVIGAVSDPPGYVQSSIATIRLWRRR